MAERKLSEQQLLFLELLFTKEIGGDVVAAKKAAGYSPNYPTSQLVRVLHDEIIEATRQYITRVGPKAVLGIVEILEKPTTLGASHKLAAAKDLLDRAGVSKTERVEVTTPGVFILPSKRPQEE